MVVDITAIIKSSVIGEVTSTIKNKIKAEAELVYNHPKGTIDITENGEYDVKNYKTAKVNIENSIVKDLQGDY